MGLFIGAALLIAMGRAPSWSCCVSAASLGGIVVWLPDQGAGIGMGRPGIRVTAISVDDQETTAALGARHKLTFPVGYGADAEAVAAITGAFVNPGPVYLQSTGFVLDPAGNVVVSVYSSGAIGRLVPDDVIGLVRYLREHSAPAGDGVSA